MFITSSSTIHITLTWLSCQLLIYDSNFLLRDLTALSHLYPTWKEAKPLNLFRLELASVTVHSLEPSDFQPYHCYFTVPGDSRYLGPGAEWPFLEENVWHFHGERCRNVEYLARKANVEAQGGLFWEICRIFWYNILREVFFCKIFLRLYLSI